MRSVQHAVMHAEGRSRTADPTDVLVVGAGPVGLALALGLARAGVGCRVIEREPRFRDRGVRGKGVNPRTLEVFDDLGVVDAILDRGAPCLLYDVYKRQPTARTPACCCSASTTPRRCCANGSPGTASRSRPAPS